jgi:hypothetical protein
VDTLSNGVPRGLAPGLAAWLVLWRHATPGFALDSLARFETRTLSFESARPGANRRLDPVRLAASIVMLSPDSSRALDFDSYLEFARDDDGSIDVGREPDSAPTLADFASDTTWRVAFCGTPCFYDGGGWVDTQRFVLTGATRTGDDADGPWCPFLELYDLRARRLDRWQGAPVEAIGFERFRIASDSALVARLESASASVTPLRPSSSRRGTRAARD